MEFNIKPRQDYFGDYFRTDNSKSIDIWTDQLTANDADLVLFGIWFVGNIRILNNESEKCFEIHKG